MPANQTIVFTTASIAEVGSGTVTAFLYSGTTLVATLASIAEHGTLRTRYTGLVVDIPAGRYRLVVKLNGFTVSDPEYTVILALTTGSFDAFMDHLAKGESVFGHSYLEAIKRIEMVAGGATLTGAGSGTEVMTSPDGTKTATFIVDPAGNISSVGFS